MYGETHLWIVFSVMLDKFGKNVRSDGWAYGHGQRFGYLVLFLSHEFCDFLKLYQSLFRLKDDFFSDTCRCYLFVGAVEDAHVQFVFQLL